jgi:hypothetical protein
MMLQLCFWCFIGAEPRLLPVSSVALFKCCSGLPALLPLCHQQWHAWLYAVPYMLPKGLDLCKRPLSRLPCSFQRRNVVCRLHDPGT